MSPTTMFSWYRGTGASMPPVIGAVALAGTALISTVVHSTGSEVSLQHYRRMSSPSSIPTVIFGDRTPQSTPQEDLNRVCDFFSPSTVLLAATLNVARQSIYNWRNGTTAIAEENAIRLRDLAQASQILNNEGIVMTNFLLKKKIMNGKTLFQRVEEGHSAVESAKLLIQILRQEQVQQQQIHERFASCQTSSLTEDFDFPPANDLI